MGVFYIFYKWYRIAQRILYNQKSGEGREKGFFEFKI